MPSNIAEKVFAIPELLENILYPLADAPDLAVETLTDPAISLFGVLRVSKSIRETIEGSIKLKRLMFLAPTDPKFEADGADQHLAPITWLHDSILNPGIEDYAYLTRDDDKFPGQLVCYMCAIKTTNTDEDYDEVGEVSEALEEFEARGGARPEASWRRMKVVCSGDDDPVVARFNCIIHNGAASKVKEFNWKFDANASLGVVYDKWVGLVKRLEQTESFFRQLNSARNRVDEKYVDEQMADVESLLG